MQRAENRWRARAVSLLCALAVLGTVESVAAAPVVFPELPGAGHASFSGSRVKTLLVHGDTLYVGGNFRVSQGGVTKTNLAAFDLSGNLKTDFTATPNGTVFALATDGVSLFVGGEFTRLGLKRRLAAVDLVTGAINRRFTAHVDGQLDVESPSGVRALSVVTDASTTPPTVRLLVGGNFTQIDSATDNRSGLAALDPESGDLDAIRFSQGVQGGFVDALLSTDSVVYVGGSFNQTQSRNGSLVALSLSGALRNTFSSSGQPIVELDFDPVANRLFAGVGGGGNRAVAYDASGASRSPLWQGPVAGGDVQSVHYYGGNVYFGFHDGLFTEPDAYKLAVVDAATGVQEVDSEHVGLACGAAEDLQANCWLPSMDSSAGGQGFFGSWAITHFIDPVTQKASLLVGGEFTQIGNVVNTRRLAIFNEP